jgi:multidrug resistance protein, MATE family
LIFVGHLNQPEYLAAIGLTDLLIYFSGGLFGIGLNEGFCSLASRAYGAKHYKLIGDYLNKAILVICTIFVILTIISFNGERILIFLK